MNERLQGLFTYLEMLKDLAKNTDYKCNREIKEVTNEINKELGISVVIGHGK
jgi:hypothetical protein